MELKAGERVKRLGIWELRRYWLEYGIYLNWDWTDYLNNRQISTDGQ